MTSTQESLKDKYWNDQIKSMLGPCMITFAIPITIPGVTITLVAFSEEKSLPKYGALHVTGLILLVVAVFLILLGCILKYLWKPFIPIDIEMQLSPHPSVRNVSGRKSKNKLDGIYRDNGDMTNRLSARESDSSSAVIPPIEISRLQNESNRADDLLASSRSDEAPSCSGLSAVHMESDDTDIVKQKLKMIGSDDETGSDDEPNMPRSAIVDANPINRLPSTNSRHLPPISPRPLTSREVDGHSPSLNEIETWRKKKRKKRKKRQPSDVSVDEGSDQGVVNQGSDCDESVVRRSKDELTVEKDTDEASG
ncbi:hypothetical protein FSP39_023228 [Pinctada imbricata]|uniref:Uncharacterized protein n=1 Tax=Pinctada imbricata TaxID=66713 RepID=A0AA88XU13_PINIB|nr:hypothetical protein FSP39_023228 [Pinctada imbricata]